MPAEAQAASDATKHSPLRALLHRALAAATRRENAEVRPYTAHAFLRRAAVQTDLTLSLPLRASQMVAGLGLVLVLLVAFLLELTVRGTARIGRSATDNPGSNCCPCVAPGPQRTPRLLLLPLWLGRAERAGGSRVQGRGERRGGAAGRVHVRSRRSWLASRHARLRQEG